MKNIDNICETLITPNLLAHGWDRATQISYIDDIDFQYKDMGVEYVLLYNRRFPIATLSVICEPIDFMHALSTSEKLGLPIAITCNEYVVHIDFRDYNGRKHHNQINLLDFPTPEDLLNLYYSCCTPIIYPRFSRSFLVGAGLIGEAFVFLVRYIFKLLMAENKNKDYLYLTNIHDDYFYRWFTENKSDLDIRFITLYDSKELVDLLEKQRVETRHSTYSICYITTIHNYISAIDYINQIYNTSAVIYQNNCIGSVILNNCDYHSYNKAALTTAPYSFCWKDFNKNFSRASIIRIFSPNSIRKEDIDCLDAPICIDTLSYDYLLDYCKESGVRPICGYVRECDFEYSYQKSPPNAPPEIGIDSFVPYIFSKRYSEDYKKIITNIENMAKETSYERQIELAYNLKSYLHGFQERLGDVAINYQRKSNELIEAGMMVETHQAFEQKCMFETIKHIKSVIEQINEQDIPFVDKFIEELEDMREKYK